MASEKLKRQAQLKVCACYYYELQTAIDDMTSEDLRIIINKPYYCHLLNDDDLNDCPEYSQTETKTFNQWLKTEI